MVYLEFPSFLRNDNIQQMIQLSEIKDQISEGVFIRI